MTIFDVPSVSSILWDGILICGEKQPNLLLDKIKQPNIYRTYAPNDVI